MPAGLDDGGRLLEHVQRAVGWGAAGGDDDGRGALDDLGEFGGGAGVPGLHDVGAEFGGGPGRVQHGFGGTLAVAPHLAARVGVADDREAPGVASSTTLVSISNMATWFDEPAEMPTATASAPSRTASWTVPMVAS